MRIATWNIERLKHKAKLDEILSACNSIGADILVLTETDSSVHPDYPYSFHTAGLSGNILYNPTENRVSIFTRYPGIRVLLTYDEFTSLCVELETDRGYLRVYGTIIGVYGNRHAEFKSSLYNQIEDIDRLAADGHNICIAGDYNLSFSDNFYFTSEGRSTLTDCFSRHSIRLLTENQPSTIDHIAVSSDFLGNGTVKVEEWNTGFALSDHKGVMVEFQPKK